MWSEKERVLRNVSIRKEESLFNETGIGRKASKGAYEGLPIDKRKKDTHTQSQNARERENISRKEL